MTTKLYNLVLFAQPLYHRARARQLGPLHLLAKVLCVFGLLTGAAVAQPTAGATNPQTNSPGEKILQKKLDVAAIYFPSWHKDDHYSTWFGENWNEWKLIEGATPRFEGHQLLKPAWGYFDEADAQWAAKQIDLAADSGLDVFIFDWYWYSGVKFIHGALENGFLKAPNSQRMKFATMWANHNWGNFFPVPYKDPFHTLLPIRHSPADFERVIQYHIDHYFNQPNYWRLNGALYFSIFAPEDFMRQLGGPEKTKVVLDAARKQVADAGLGKVHFGAFSGIPQSMEPLKAGGFESITTYNIQTGSSSFKLPDHPLENYDHTIKRSEAYWDGMDLGILPYAPVVTVGWDTTYRWEKDVPWPAQKNEYPFTPVIIGNTPEKVGEMFRRARQHAVDSPHHAPFILINAWNEWTEGSALLPNTQYGNGYLEQIKKVLDDAAEKPKPE